MTEVAAQINLNPSHYKIHNYKYIRSVGSALLSLYDPFPNYYDLVLAPVSRYFSFVIECLNQIEPPVTLPVMLIGRSTTIYLESEHGNIGIYSASYQSVERVPYFTTA
jgi:hypothetical protein